MKTSYVIDLVFEIWNIQAIYHVEIFQIMLCPFHAFVQLVLAEFGVAVAAAAESLVEPAVGFAKSSNILIKVNQIMK